MRQARSCSQDQPSFGVLDNIVLGLGKNILMVIGSTEPRRCCKCPDIRRPDAILLNIDRYFLNLIIFSGA